MPEEPINTVLVDLVALSQSATVGVHSGLTQARI